jgi:hypothetical protein
MPTRLELSRLEPTRSHKISHNPMAINRLFVDLFLEPNEIILDSQPLSPSRLAFSRCDDVWFADMLRTPN